MQTRRRERWDDDYEVYSENQVESVLEKCGIEVVSDTNSHFLCYCPFHGNTDSPAFAVDKSKGLYTCFNPSCDNSGTLQNLIMRINKVGVFQAQRMIIKARTEHVTPFSDRLKQAMEQAPEYPAFSQDVLDRMKAEFPGSVGERYMKSRGFIDETLDYFDVGFSAKQNMVIVPMHDPNGNPVGLIGRTPSKEDKRFKNSLNLPKSKTAWNFHRAKRCGDTVIVCEASYDAMRIHQAGYENVIALLGGHVTDYHLQQIAKHFSKVVIMTDFDERLKPQANCRRCAWREPNQYGIRCVGHRPGRELGHSIAKGLPNKKIMWAAYDNSVVYPHHAKDASDMTDQEIRQCLKNAVSNLEYVQWNVENKDLLVA